MIPTRFGLLGLVVLSSSVACAGPVPATRKVESSPAPPMPDSLGMTVSTGSVLMSGASEVECEFTRQAPIHLRISVLAECPSSRLDLLVQTPQKAYSETMPVALEAPPGKTTFSSFSFPLPAPGTLVRTRVSAHCSDVPDKRIWGLARCLVATDAPMM